MKIILYTYDIMKIGGIETSFFNLAQYLKSKGYEVGVRYTVIAPMQMERYKKAGIDVSIQKKESCDILFIGSVWRRPNNITARLVVQQVHADWSDDFWDGAPVGIKLLKGAEAGCDVFAAVSNSSANFVSGQTDKPVIVMNNLAPKNCVSKTMTHKKGSKLVVAAFTRMSTEKGLKNYEALRDRLKELKIEAELRVYTNGDAPKGWKAYEPVPDITMELPEIDFVASLADTESFGYTIAEANSCGVPCIIKHTNSTAEFFSDKSNVIVDTIADLDIKALRRKSNINYTLYTQTSKNIDKTMKQLEKLAAKKCIIKSMRSWKDLEAKKNRYAGEVFAVTNKRAKELLSNKFKIVEII